MNKNLRVGGYQYLFYEIPMEFKTLCSVFTNEDGAYHAEHTEESFKELNQKINNYLLSILTESEEFTPHQTKMITLYLEGKNETEIGKVLNMTQGSVHKLLWGRPTTWDKVKFKTNTEIYGGLYNKISKMLLKDETYRKLVLELYEILNSD